VSGGHEPKKEVRTREVEAVGEESNYGKGRDGSGGFSTGLGVARRTERRRALAQTNASQSRGKQVLLEGKRIDGEMREKKRER